MIQICIGASYMYSLSSATPPPKKKRLSTFPLTSADGPSLDSAGPVATALCKTHLLPLWLLRVRAPPSFPPSLPPPPVRQSTLAKYRVATMSRPVKLPVTEHASTSSEDTSDTLDYEVHSPHGIAHTSRKSTCRLPGIATHVDERISTSSLPHPSSFSCIHMSP